MKRNKVYFLFFIFGLLAVFYFLSKESNSELKEPAKIARPTKSLKIIEEKIQKKNTQQPVTVSNVVNTDKPCWEKIREQYQESPDFSINSRAGLSRVVGEWYYDKNAIEPGNNTIESSAQGMFFLALAKADLLNGTKKNVDFKEALSLLEKAAEIDPLNSAPFLYAAIIENKRGNKSQAEYLLKQAYRSQYFNSYVKDFTVALFSEVKTPSDLLAAQDIWMTTPIPDYIALKEIIDAPSNTMFANQLVQDGLNSERSKVTDLSWIPIEYLVGKKILDKHKFGANIPDMKQITANEILNETSNSVLETLSTTCDLNSLQKHLDKLQRHLNSIR